MPQHRHWMFAAALLVAACGKDGPAPPEGELRSALAVTTVAGDAFDPASLDGDVTVVAFWSPG